MATAQNAFCTSSTHHRSPAYLPTCLPQPIGESHDQIAGSSRPPTVSPTARKAYATPSTAIADPVAERADTVSWAVTPAIAAKARPVAAQDIPNESEPAAGSPAAIWARAISTPSVSIVPNATSRAADNAARRPTTVDPTSSSRPFSSSALVCRPTSMIANTARTAAPNAASFMITKAPSAEGSHTRPYIATNAGMSLTADAAATLDATDGYSPTVAVALDTTVSTKAAITTGSSTRSRRSASRVSARVPVNSLIGRPIRRSGAGPIPRESAAGWSA